jgi:elongation factor P
MLDCDWSSDVCSSDLNLEVTVLFYKGRAVNITLPNFIEAVVTWTEPAVKGDTANNITKNATIDTGAEIKVPIFINEGDLLKIDTREGGAYVSRLNK